MYACRPRLNLWTTLRPRGALAMPTQHHQQNHQPPSKDKRAVSFMYRDYLGFIVLAVLVEVTPSGAETR